MIPQYDIEQASIKLKSSDDKSIMYYSTGSAAYFNSKPIDFSCASIFEGLKTIELYEQSVICSKRS